MLSAPRKPNSDDPRIDGAVPSDDNESAMDIALAGDAISDKLEYAVHRAGLTPRLKILMAALRRLAEFGDVKFGASANHPRALLHFLNEGRGLAVYSSREEPAFSLPNPLPSFARPRWQR